MATIPRPVTIDSPASTGCMTRRYRSVKVKASTGRAIEQ